MTKKTFDEKLNDLKKELDPVSPKEPTLHNLMWQASFDLSACLIVGVGGGALLDHFFKIGHIGIIIGFLLGAAAGLLNVYKNLKKLGYGFNSSKHPQAVDNKSLQDQTAKIDEKK